MGGYMVAMTIEKWNLHKRIALKVLTTVGCTPPRSDQQDTESTALSFKISWQRFWLICVLLCLFRLLLGFMIATMLLSMWISNTATTTMMIPIVEAVLQQLKKHYVGETSGKQRAQRAGVETFQQTNARNKHYVETCG